jgi:hypothetical protein
VLAYIRPQLDAEADSGRHGFVSWRIRKPIRISE